MAENAQTNYVGGAWRGDPRGEIRTQRSPIDESEIGQLTWSSRVLAQEAIAAARTAQGEWRKVSTWDRARSMRRIGDAIARRREQLATLLTLEQGKPYAEAFFEVGKSVDGFNLAADLVKYLEGATIPTEDPTKRVMTFYRPRGVYAVVTPWNFPVNIPVEYIAPGLAAGNTIVWAPAPTTALVAVALVEAIEDADLPPGILNLVTGAGAVVGDEIVSNPGTDAVGFTGSAATGKLISQRAAGKPQLMELGGNGPVVILEDADLDLAAAATASGSFVNAGQVCSSSERILVHRKVYDEFAERMAHKAREVVLGDPRKAGTTMGPLNNPAVARKVAEHVGDALNRGAQAITGGKRPDDALSPLFFEPTVLTNVSREALINTEETFGPVAPLLVIDNDEQAFELARDNRYGLVSSVFTQDINRAFRYIEEMPTGIVNINDTSNYWELHIPFGGASGKDSGMGRVGGKHALTAMCDLKTATFTVR
ncbi:aldehyde dehydrogenase family protein [Devosia sp. ZB163]|uniref:aldehyde dehydrogenase family protein n=1 Tax=Devosia sp. ZB163 TaxID=3025938 RepID=UPI0023615CDC|nr:aldehyde dehydrogenase family protein [Devosia sp. ZB163]MDC9825352.1 aldehyde dehydrogenase family protein [Devosia sp. ZB163]